MNDVVDDLRRHIAAIVLDDKGRLRPRHIAEPGALLDAAIEAALTAMRPELDLSAARQRVILCMAREQFLVEAERDRLGAAVQRVREHAQGCHDPAPAHDIELRGYRKALTDVLGLLEAEGAPVVPTPRRRNDRGPAPTECDEPHTTTEEEVTCDDRFNLRNSPVTLLDAVIKAALAELGYPRPEGEATAIGPDTVISSDGAVISHRGENYYRITEGSSAAEDVVVSALVNVPTWTRETARAFIGVIRAKEARDLVAQLRADNRCADARTVDGQTARCTKTAGGHVWHANGHRRWRTVTA